MTKARRTVFAVPLLLCLAAGNIPQSQGSTVIVTRKETKLRSAKRLFASPVADLREGDKLEVVSKDGAWLSLKFKPVPASTIEGWLHETDVSANKEVRLSGEGVRENYSASEAAAAKKGFNPQVEREYRGQNPNLNAAFAMIDKLQVTKASEPEVKDFLVTGGLLKEEAR
jgi:hypothetical protein